MIDFILNKFIVEYVIEKENTQLKKIIMHNCLPEFYT